MKKETELEHFMKSSGVTQRSICKIAFNIEENNSCVGIDCDKCKFYNGIDKILETLLKEHKEPIRLTQLEYDLLEVYYNNAYKSNYNQLLRSYNVICKLKEKGYFKNLDLDMTIGEFKENVEVVENVD